MLAMPHFIVLQNTIMHGSVTACVTCDRGRERQVFPGLTRFLVPTSSR